MSNENKCKWNEEWKHNGITVIDCNTCGFKHQYPYPEQNEVNDLYKSSYYEDYKPEYLDIVKEDEEHFKLWAQKKKHICERFLPANIQSPAILDIGSSFGQTLKAFSKESWRCVGVEPSKFAAQYASDNIDARIFNDMLENIETAKLNPKFNIVHMAEVINHLRDPANTLERIYEELIADDGMLVVETSNDFSSLQWAIVEKYDDVPWWIVPDHVTYFDKNSLSSLLEKVGFKVRHVETTFPMEIFPMMGDNYRTDPKIGKQCHQRRVEFETNMYNGGRESLLNDMYSTLADIGIGRSIIIYAQK